MEKEAYLEERENCGSKSGTRQERLSEEGKTLSIPKEFCRWVDIRAKTF